MKKVGGEEGEDRARFLRRAYFLIKFLLTGIASLCAKRDWPVSYQRHNCHVCVGAFVGRQLNARENH